MRVGDVVERRVRNLELTREEADGGGKRLRGRVVYVHPLGRFHTVEFTLPGGTFRESFRGTGSAKK